MARNTLYHYIYYKILELNCPQANVYLKPCISWVHLLHLGESTIFEKTYHNDVFGNKLSNCQGFGGIYANCQKI